MLKKGGGVIAAIALLCVPVFGMYLAGRAIAQSTDTCLVGDGMYSRYSCSTLKKWHECKQFCDSKVSELPYQCVGLLDDIGCGTIGEY